jgi:hypothetical protein
MSSFKNKNKKISICTLISTAVVGVALATALPLTLNSCKKKNNNGGVIDGDRLSDLKVGDNLIGKYFLMPTDG